MKTKAPNSERPAAPCQYIDHDSAGQECVREQYFGLTKREYFAGLAMQGLLASVGYRGQISIAQKHSYLTVEAVNFADDLLAALDQS